MKKLILAAALLLSACGAPAYAQECRELAPIIADAASRGWSQPIVLNKKESEIFLQMYNSEPPETNYTADEIAIAVHAGRGEAAVLFLTNGFLCRAERGSVVAVLAMMEAAKERARGL